MPKSLISVDLRRSPAEQEILLHNRWHPEIPPVVSVNPGAVFRIECMDWTGGQIGDNDSANDVRDVELPQVHYLSGPIAVSGAEPGDILVVDLLDIGALPDSEWGFTGIFAKQNGGGFLTEHYPEAKKAIWNFSGIYATSRHIQGVRFAGLTHPGLIGCAPSAELLATWNKREAALIATAPTRVPPLAAPPNPQRALLGQLRGAQFDRVVMEAARTVPPREHGGNCDIKNLSRGSRIYFPVYCKGGNLSMGDIHFSQGDGEISFCGAIEMAGWIDLHVDLIKGGMSKYGMLNPIFKPGPVEPRYSEYLVFEGISVDEQGTQLYLDAHVAYRRACLNAIEYLKKFGYSGEQAYMLLSTAPVEGRVSGIVDIPNACCTVAIPTEIFDFDIRPSTKGPVVAPRGMEAAAS
ncbi:MAG: acetamidase/formamidase family protein [Deltaproteobacteria bacterium]|nr:acetamidase/formamidase family protein [Deltaproteobacteria bacterium]